MAFSPGDRVVAETESTERPARHGVVEEVLRDDPHPRYRIRWNDGHESIYTPADGALRRDEPARSSAQSDGAPQNRAGLPARSLLGTGRRAISAGAPARLPRSTRRALGSVRVAR